jgi:hypothetical protein
MDFLYEQPLMVRDGLFLAASRTYGEQYIEPLIRFRYDLSRPTSNDHDAKDVDGNRIEIKACKVLESSANREGTRSLLERVLYENENLPTKRMIEFEDHLNRNYDANVQNVKRNHFEYLLYVLLFKDCVKVFRAETNEIATGRFKGWSDKHGRYDELGKSGQFSVSKSTIEWHLENHLMDTIKYQEVYDILESVESN